jgi:predicted transposase/invertase (TIGR01784 family)
MYMVAKEAAEVAAEKAFENGFSAGEERGISIGLSQGAREAKIETTKSMKLENMSISMISHFTGLTPDEIEKL